MVSIPWPSTLRHNETPVQATSSISALDPLSYFSFYFCKRLLPLWKKCLKFLIKTNKKKQKQNKLFQDLTSFANIISSYPLSDQLCT